MSVRFCLSYDCSKLDFIVFKVEIIMSPTEEEGDRRGGGHIVFGAEPVGIGVSVSVYYIPHRRGGGHIVFWCGSCWRRR